MEKFQAMKAAFHEGYDRDSGRWQLIIRSGAIGLSIVAGGGLYSTPRYALESFDQYGEYEVAILNFGTMKAPRNYQRYPNSWNWQKHLLRPEGVGLHTFAHLFDADNNPVAGYVSPADIQKMIDVIMRKQRRKKK